MYRLRAGTLQEGVGVVLIGVLLLGVALEQVRERSVDDAVVVARPFRRSAVGRSDQQASSDVADPDLPAHCVGASRADPYRVVLSHHKTGTVLLRNVFEEIAGVAGLRFHNVSDPAEGLAAMQGKDAPCPGDFLFEDHSQAWKIAGLSHVRGIHAVRHPFEVVCSCYRYHLVTDEAWVHVPLPELGNLTYQAHLKSLSPPAGLLFEMQEGSAWDTIQEMYRWNYGDPRFVTMQLEDVVADMSAAAERIAAWLQLDPETTDQSFGNYDVTRGAQTEGHATSRNPGKYTWPHMFLPEHYAAFHAAFPADTCERIAGMRCPRSIEEARAAVTKDLAEKGANSHYLESDAGWR